MELASVCVTRSASEGTQRDWTTQLLRMRGVHAAHTARFVIAGRMDGSIGYEIFGLFPAALTVHVGDTVVWKAVGELAHALYFPTQEVLDKKQCWNGTNRFDCGNVNGIGGAECLPVDPTRPLSFRGEANPNPGVCSLPSAIAPTPPPGNDTSPVAYNPYLLYPFPFPPKGPVTLIYPGVGWVSSGQIATTPGSVPSFTVTFNTTGVYTVQCALAPLPVYYNHPG